MLWRDIENLGYDCDVAFHAEGNLLQTMWIDYLISNKSEATSASTFTSCSWLSVADCLSAKRWPTTDN